MRGQKRSLFFIFPVVAVILTFGVVIADLHVFPDKKVYEFLDSRIVKRPVSGRLLILDIPEEMLFPGPAERAADNPGIGGLLTYMNPGGIISGDTVSGPLLPAPAAVKSPEKWFLEKIWAGLESGLLSPAVPSREVPLLFYRGDEAFYSPLFTGVYEYLGSPGLTLLKDRIILQGARYPGMGIKDSVIPLSRAEGLLFRPFSSDERIALPVVTEAELMELGETLDKLVSSLRQLKDSGFYDDRESEDDPLTFFEEARQLNSRIRTENDPNVRASLSREYRNNMDLFREAVETLPETELALPEDTSPYQAALAQVGPLFDDFSSEADTLSFRISGALCITGEGAGKSAAFANTLLTENYLDALPWWYVLAGALAASLIIAFVMSRLKTGIGLIIGFLLFLFLTVLCCGVYILLDIYVSITAFAVPLFLAWAAGFAFSTVHHTFNRRIVRTFYNRAFPSPVVDRIISTSGIESLDGVRTETSAMVIDMSPLHIAAEGMEPRHAVNMIRRYQDSIRRVIFSVRGTLGPWGIDDSVALFGAPLEMENHSVTACETALDLQTELSGLAEKLREQGIQHSPSSLSAGIISRSSTVGNLWDTANVNYSPAGNAALLLRSLPAANSRYGTLILVTEEVVQKTGEQFVFRQLDKVRRLESDSPVYLYELVDRSTNTTPLKREVLALFREGMELYGKKSWIEAHKKFIEAVKRDESDGPSAMYARRCQKFAKQPPSPSWDGVYTL